MIPPKLPPKVASLLALTQTRFLEQALSEMAAGKSEIYFGMDRSIGNSDFEVPTVIFKEKMHDFVRYFAELIEITNIQPPPQLRLRGSETEEHKMYYRFRSLRLLPTPIPLSDLRHAVTRNGVPPSTPGAILIEPLAISGKQGHLTADQVSYPSAVLRPLNEDERNDIATLEPASRPAENTWVDIEKEIGWAEKSEIDPKIQRLIDADLTDSALEGITAEQRVKIRRRAAWLAQKFAKHRRDVGMLQCDECGFDPVTRADGTLVKPRSLMDVHHTTPLDGGKRYTTLHDFNLLCPTCHRFVHMELRVKQT